MKEYKKYLEWTNKLSNAYHYKDRDEFIGTATRYIMELKIGGLDYLTNLVKAYDKGEYKRKDKSHYNHDELLKAGYKFHKKNDIGHYEFTNNKFILEMKKNLNGYKLIIGKNIKL